MTMSAAIVERLPYRLLMSLPRSLAVPILALRSPGRSDVADRLSLDLDEHVRVRAYWLRFNGTSGPAISVFFDDEELLRIDGLAGSPHLHYCLSESRARLGQRRVEIPLSSDGDMIERICFELENNLGFALQLHRRRSVQGYAVDAAQLTSAAMSVRDHLQDCVRRNRAAESSVRTATENTP